MAKTQGQPGAGEEALSESFAPQSNEPLLREAADSAPAPVWMTNAQGAVEFINRAFCELTGIPFDQALGDAWLTVLHPEDIARVREARAAAWAAGHAPYSFEARFRRRDGEWRWFEVSSRPRIDSAGRFHGYVGLAVDRTEARAAQQALAESEARLRLAIEAGRMGVWEWDVASHRVRWSRELEMLHGLAPGTFAGTFEAFQADIHPDDREAVRAAVARTLEQGDAHHVEYRIVTPQGELRWVEGRGKLFPDEAGRPVRMVGVCADVSERKQAEGALRASERRYRELVSGLNDVIVWEGDPATFRFTFVSGAAEGVLGYPASRWIEEPSFWIDHMHPEDRAWAIDYCAKHTAAGVDHEFEYRMIAADGRIVWLRDSVYVSEQDGRRISRGLMVDITARKHAEETLRASEERYRAVVESQSELVCRFTREGQILFVNGAYARARGATVEELVGANFWAWVAASDRPAVKAMMESLTPETPEVRIENRFHTVEGERWMLWINRALSFDKDGRWIEAQSTGVDIHERKQAEQHTKLLLDELNHRVKNTLAVVQGIAQQTFKTTDLDARRAFEGRLGALSKAHDLLTERRWASAPLAALVDDVSHFCGDARERIHADGPTLLLNPRQALSITMALHELCTNAMKYGALSVETGRVDLTWRVIAEQAPRLELTWRESGGPQVRKPRQRGYGSVMIERALAHDLQGHAKLDFQPTGLVCTIEAPLEA